MQRGIQRVSKMVLVLGFLLLLWGCTAGAGDSPSPAPTFTATFTQAPTATATATWQPTATAWPTATPVPKPAWGRMWEEVPCSWQPQSVPEGIRGPGPGEKTWYGLSGRRLVPIPMGPGRWLPLRYDSQDGWTSEALVVEDKTDPDAYPRSLISMPWGAIVGDSDSKWLEEERRFQYLTYRVIEYDWLTEQVYCVKWLGSIDQKGGRGPLILRFGSEGVLLWDPKGDKVYGLKGRGLEVAWEAPYESVALTAGRKAYEEVLDYSYWTEGMWHLLVMAKKHSGQEEWSTEGYDVATGAHRYVQLSPRPWGGWRDWTWKNIKYSWDNRRLALLQWYHPTNEFRILVYPLGECLESGEALCEPKVYPLNKKYLDWERPCQWPGQMFWSPEGDTLYLSVSGVSPYGVWKSWCQEREIQIWELDVTCDNEAAWEQVEVKPTEALLREAKRQGNPTRLGSTSWGGIAWDAEGKRLLVRVPRGDDYHYYVYAWLYLEPDDESKRGVMEPMGKEEVPFGLVLPWSFEEERGW